MVTKAKVGEAAEAGVEEQVVRPPRRPVFGRKLQRLPRRLLCWIRIVIEEEILDSKSLQAALGVVTIAAMHPQNAMLETSPELCSARPRTGEPNATFGCTEASTPAWPSFHVHSINASVGPSPDEATTATWRYQSNQQYSITAVTTSSGSVAERCAYTAYGQPTILDGSGSILSSSAINNRYTYTGREWDPTLGLYHFRARWMSGLAGRFMGRDPIGYDGSPFDLYEFLLSNPIRYTDPTGLITSVGEAWAEGLLWGNLYSIKTWLTASSKDGCQLNPESVIGDTIAQGSSFTFPGVTVGVVEKAGPITFTRPAKASCCCPNEQVECAVYTVHAQAVMGIGVGFSAGGGVDGSIESTIELARHDHWIKVAVCADNSRFSEVASRWISGPPGDRIHHLANGRYNSEVFGEPWGAPVITFETFRTDLGKCAEWHAPHLVDRIVLP
jgi:RHS repeat-associated protein